ncbi:hypothetical protein FH972_022935 [Carpinus fangiana]|uniref:Uncharacterized protein n=1 Tax=Carpinus fangiana TaxID=176857 RepID=A0A5N6KTP8_9ROSI|nr:hypothetical protein FH972_022935 [Carpinus fangiana]
MGYKLRTARILPGEVIAGNATGLGDLTFHAATAQISHRLTSVASSKQTSPTLIMSAPTVNGEKLHSQTLDHFTSYPLVSDVLGIYQSNSLGKKSIDLYNRAYSTFAEPIVPYFQTPYSYVKPYLERVDSFGNSSLDSVDTHFPAVTKTNIDGLRDFTAASIQYPFKVAGEGRDYFLNTYNDEYKKAGGEGIVFRGKALITTEFRIASEVLHAVGDYLGPKKDELTAKLDELKKIGADKVEQAKKTGSSKADELHKHANSTAKEVKSETKKQTNAY